METVKPKVDLKEHQTLGHWWRVLIARHSETASAEESLLRRINWDIRSNNFKTYVHNE